MISVSEINRIIAPAEDSLDRAALHLVGAPRWRIEAFVADVRRGMIEETKKQLPALDDETIAQIADVVAERIAQRAKAFRNSDWGRA